MEEKKAKTQTRGSHVRSGLRVSSGAYSSVVRKWKIYSDRTDMNLTYSTATRGTVELHREQRFNNHLSCLKMCFKFQLDKKPAASKRLTLDETKTAKHCGPSLSRAGTEIMFKHLQIDV